MTGHFEEMARLQYERDAMPDKKGAGSWISKS